MELTYLIRQPVQAVFAALSDMQQFAALHPVITRIGRMDTGLFRVYETMKLGIVPVSFTYKAEVKPDFVHLSVNMLAMIRPGTRICLQFRLSEKDGQTIVHELIEVKSPLPIRGIMERVLKKQHAILFRNIETQLVENV